jgi:hypothetical protein
MHNEVDMSCDDIKKRLQPFLDDLLAEDEFKAFRDHINVCGKCEKYVRSIGSLSNQLWKLGKVRVPEDLGSTIMYKLAHPEEKAQPSKFVISKKHIVIGSILILLALFFGIIYFKKFKVSQKIAETPIITRQIIIDQKPPTKPEAEMLLEELQGIKEALGPSEKEESVEKPSTVTESSATSKAAIIEPKLLHWHFIVSEKSDETELEGEKRQKEFELKQKLAEKKQLEDDIKSQEEKTRIVLGKMYTVEILKKETAEEKEEREISVINIEKEMYLIELRIIKMRKENRDEEAKRAEELYMRLQKAYTEEIKKVKEARRNSMGLELEQKLKKKEELEVPIKSLEDEILSIELKIQQALEEKRREAGRQQKLFDALKSLNIMPYYKTQDLILFNATGEKIDNLIEKVFSISQQGTPLRDFTAGTSTFKDKESRVSIYFENPKIQNSGVLHWHIGLMFHQQKVKLLDVIQSMGGSIDYELEEIIVLSIPKTEVENLKKRIQVMGVIFTEFGKLESKEGQLSSMPVKVSVYFQGGK